MDRYEETLIINEKLPKSWRTQKDLDDLSEFLQQNWEQRAVFYEDGKVESRQQFLGFTGQCGIRTNNYIGTVAFNGEQLNIYPKMFRTDIADQDTSNLSQKHLMNNLVKWLGYCNKMDYPFINISADLNDSDDLREFFITLYIGYVRAALERGHYYQYVEETEDIGNIKGKFDIKDYFVNKIPNGQANHFRCTYSTFEFDNIVNRIIKFTCKQILNEASPKNQKALRNILVRLNEVTDVTCKPNDCNGIRLSKMHKQYRIIISMSKMFLLNKTSTYSIDSHESFCFLFPTELLFEGFVGGFMQDLMMDYNVRVKLQQSDMPLIEDIHYAGRSLGSAFTMRHDIVVRYEEKIYVLDTKYKAISRFEGYADRIRNIINNETKQSDIYQVCEYARKRNVNDVYLVYPMFRFEENEPDFPVGVSKDAKGNISVHFIRLPFIFEDDDERVRGVLVSIMKEIFGIDNAA